MSGEQKRRFEAALEFYRNSAPWPTYPLWKLLAGVCLTRLEDFPAARQAYASAVDGFLKDAARTWALTGEVNHLVDAYSMAHRDSYALGLAQALESYRTDPKSDALYASYAFALAGLSGARHTDVGVHTDRLLSRPKVKDTHAMGQTIAAILADDQTGLDEALAGLLRVHHGRVKHGSLRETAEGYLCLPAMSLAKVALQRGMAVHEHSEYLSRGYLDYLLSEVSY